MRVHLDCFPCFLRQTLDAVRFVTDDEAVHEAVLRESNAPSNHVQGFAGVQGMPVDVELPEAKEVTVMPLGNGVGPLFGRGFGCGRGWGRGRGRGRFRFSW